MNTIRYNALPRPTFRWLKVNDTETAVMSRDLEDGGEALQRATVSVEHVGAVVTELTECALLEPAYPGAEASLLADVSERFTTGLHVAFAENASETADVVTIRVAVPAGAVDERVRVRIAAAAGSNGVVRYVFEGDAAAHGTVSLLTEVDAADGAKLAVNKLQLLGAGVQQVEQRYTKLGAAAEATFVNVEIGGGENILNYEDDLVGDESSIAHDLAYLGGGEQRFDVWMRMTHRGRKTVSDIHNLGALNGVSKKSFRGTLDFKNGSTGSDGAEEDICLLLNSDVKSISLPLLLCKEDNVVGNHAASAGQIDQNKLFYLMSRGFSEIEAKHIIVESMLRPVIDKLGDEAMEEAALEAVRAKI